MKTPTRLPSLGCSGSWQTQGQINTPAHDSCAPHTPKTIAGGLCWLLSSQTARETQPLDTTGDVLQSRMGKKIMVAELIRVKSRRFHENKDAPCQ